MIKKLRSEKVVQPEDQDISLSGLLNFMKDKKTQNDELKLLVTENREHLTNQINLTYHSVVEMRQEFSDN